MELKEKPKEEVAEEQYQNAIQAAANISSPCFYEFYDPPNGQTVQFIGWVVAKRKKINK